MITHDAIAMKTSPQQSSFQFTSPVYLAGSLCLVASIFGLVFNPGQSLAQRIANQFTRTGVSGGGRLLSATLNAIDPNQALLVCDMTSAESSTPFGLNSNPTLFA